MPAFSGETVAHGILPGSLLGLLGAVISSLENVADYQVFEATIYAEYQPRTASSRELVARLASVLWRLRRCTSIETGLLQI